MSLDDAPLSCGDGFRSILACVCFDDGVDMCGDGLHACFPVNKIGLHYTVQAIAWGFDVK